MASLTIKMSLDNYGSLMFELSQPDTSALRDNLAANAVLDENDIVSIKLSGDDVSSMLGRILDKYDYPVDSMYTAAVIQAREERRAKEAEEQRIKDEYEQWLCSVIAKYANDESLNCKDICSLINENDLKPGMRPLKFQSIMRQLKAYRKN